MSEGFPLNFLGRLTICRTDGKVILGKSFCPPAISLTLADIVLASCGLGCLGGGGFLWKAKSIAGVNATHEMTLVLYDNGVAFYQGVIPGGLVLEKYSTAVPQCAAANYIEDVSVDVTLRVDLGIQLLSDEECCLWVCQIVAVLVENPTNITLFGASGNSNECASTLKVGDTLANLQPCGGTAVVDEL